MKHIATAHHFILGFGRDERGVSAVEYALLAAMIALGIILAAKNLSTSISGVFSTVGSSI